MTTATLVTITRTRGRLLPPMPELWPTLEESVDRWIEHRVQNGWARPRTRSGAAKLFQRGGNAKTKDTPQLSLAPADESGTDLCPYRTPGCTHGCVSHNGHGERETVHRAKVTRSTFFLTHPHHARALMFYECETNVLNGLNPPRLETFSEVMWEREFPALFDIPNFTAYDYAKGWKRRPPTNYHLTLSASERTSLDQIRGAVDAGRNVAVVLDVRGGIVPGTGQLRPIPDTFHGMPMVDGDASDKRYLDPTGVIVGLRAKGRIMGTGMVFRTVQ